MIELRAIPPNEYVKLINSLNGQAHPGRGRRLVTYTVTGMNLDQRTHLNIPRNALSASASSIIALRQRGVFCFPILAPLDEDRPVAAKTRMRKLS
jgi:hypothetical protein